MNLEKGLQKILDLTSFLTNFLDFQKFINIKVPGSNLMDMLGFEEGEGIQSVSDIIDVIKDVTPMATTAASLVKCATNGMGTSDFWLNLGGSAAMGITSVLASIADVVIDAISCQLEMAVGQIVSTITNLVSAFHNVINSALLVLKALEGLKDWAKKVDIDINLSIQDENCADMYAAIAACYLNKFLGPYITEFKEKVVEEVNKGGRQFNDFLYEQLQDANTLAAYAEQESFLIKKAELQIRGLTRENLIGL